MALEFEAEVRKWGNSLGIVIDKSIRDTFKLAPGDKVSCSIEPLEGFYAMEVPQAEYKKWEQIAKFLIKFPELKGYTLNQVTSLLLKTRMMRVNEASLRPNKTSVVKEWLKFLEIYYDLWRQPDKNYALADKYGAPIRKGLLLVAKRFANYKPTLEPNKFNQAWLFEFRQLGDFDMYNDVFLLKIANFALLRNFTHMPLAEAEKHIKEKFEVDDMTDFFSHYINTTYTTKYHDLCRAFLTVTDQFPDYPVKQ